MTTSIGSDVTRLVKLDLATGKELETLATDPRCDVGGVMVQPRHATIVQAVAFNYLRNEWKVLDPSIEADFAALRKLTHGDFAVVSRDRADRTWIVAYTVTTARSSTTSTTADARRRPSCSRTSPRSRSSSSRRCEPVVITRARRRSSCRELPHAARSGVPAKDLPMVLYVHGGPWARDSWGYNPDAPVARQPRLRGAPASTSAARPASARSSCNAGDQQWGAQDAGRPDRRREVGDRRRASPTRSASPSWAAPTAATPRSPASPSRPTSSPAAWTSSGRRTSRRCSSRSRPTGRRCARLCRPAHGRRWTRTRVLNQQMLAAVPRGPDPRAAADRAGRRTTRASTCASPTRSSAAMRAKSLPVEYVVYADEGHGFARPREPAGLLRPRRAVPGEVPGRPRRALRRGEGQLGGREVAVSRHLARSRRPAARGIGPPAFVVGGPDVRARERLPALSSRPRALHFPPRLLQRLLPRRLELVARVPRRQLRAVRDVEPHHGSRAACPRPRRRGPSRAGSRRSAGGSAAARYSASFCSPQPGGPADVVLARARSRAPARRRARSSAGRSGSSSPCRARARPPPRAAGRARPTTSRSSRSDLPLPITATSAVRPKTLPPSMLRSAAMRPSGNVGCAA